MSKRRRGSRERKENLGDEKGGKGWNSTKDKYGKKQQRERENAQNDRLPDLAVFPFPLVII